VKRADRCDGDGWSTNESTKLAVEYRPNIKGSKGIEFFYTSPLVHSSDWSRMIQTLENSIDEFDCI
jgi:hypothetical protein